MPGSTLPSKHTLAQVPATRYDEDKERVARERRMRLEDEGERLRDRRIKLDWVRDRLLDRQFPQRTYWS
jgi:hypothetical protein